MATANEHLRRIARHIAEHTALYLRDPEAAHIWDSTVIGIPGPVKTLLLHTKGRKTGQDRSTVLQYFTPDGLYVVVGSKAGVADHPAWYLNLLAEPNCRFQAGAFGTKARARSVTGEEYEQLWQYVCAEQPEYIKYQQRTDRQIPVVVLDPIED